MLMPLAGWQRDLAEIRRWEDLPDEARAYVRRLQEVLGVPICGVTVGPSRGQILPTPGQRVL